MSITHLEPQNIWKNFAALNAVPRPSKKEERVIAFIKNFGENLEIGRASCRERVSSPV